MGSELPCVLVSIRRCLDCGRTNSPLSNGSERILGAGGPFAAPPSAAAAATRTKPRAQAVGRGCHRLGNPGRGEIIGGPQVRLTLASFGPMSHPPFCRRCRGSGDGLASSLIACAMGWNLPPLPRLKAGEGGRPPPSPSLKESRHAFKQDEKAWIVECFISPITHCEVESERERRKTDQDHRGLKGKTGDGKQPCLKTEKDDDS